MSDTTRSQPLALITGASTGIGATYADRLAKRGYDLILVARDVQRLNALSDRLQQETGVSVTVLPADLTRSEDLTRVEEFIRATPQISLLVNNAGASLKAGFENSDANAIENLIALNVTSVARLSRVAFDGLISHKDGAIINIASVMALAPELQSAVYSATKAFVLTFSQTLQFEMAGRGLYVQAVLPAATRTEIWERSGKNIDEVPGVMEVGELVDAALLGFDRKEKITIPPLQDEKQWNDFDALRGAMVPNFLQAHAAPRYKA
ncbi:SDR family oxidoreductase [Rahnella sp. C60]|uniref:NADP-dependent 3-hydroxy acid dehydrogenase YdfG n=1 Tax=Rahnella perminowiae TaxID=2816244 RepID=A0ABS6KXC5_9GAMM|nr:MULTISPECIES: SDR family oxidoreductase [Rahnella]UJD88901.1 SDR family oxidoreductase [Rahnella aquatilis]MBU9811559.1 SDR family oxidoreductase [Rahnella perminowiae]MBU9815056.1 SDR family oxidoreductase [Rahnella perminowiae]MBU9834063.1 SDR family oxidoreductase [Rahnella perminowiae]MCR9002018.1 SDR family oxidoreductase [Rahnella perminowiae]